MFILTSIFDLNFRPKIFGWKKIFLAKKSFLAEKITFGWTKIIFGRKKHFCEKKIFFGRKIIFTQKKFFWLNIIFSWKNHFCLNKNHFWLKSFERKNIFLPKKSFLRKKYFLAEKSFLRKKIFFGRKNLCPIKVLAESWIDRLFYIFDRVTFGPWLVLFVWHRKKYTFFIIPLMSYINPIYSNTEVLEKIQCGYRMPHPSDCPQVCFYESFSMMFLRLWPVMRPK